MTTVEFFLDPMCPWAWLASRWITDIAPERKLALSWRSVSLRLVNRDRDYSVEFPPGYLEHHNRSLRLLRVWAAAKATHGNDAAATLYTAYGQMIHEQRRHQVFDDPAAGGLIEALDTAGLPHDLALDADDDTWDGQLQNDVDDALQRVGVEAGTPIISINPPTGPSVFGPVLSRELSGAEGVRFWDALVTIMSEPGFSELKRRRPRRSEFQHTGGAAVHDQGAHR